MTRLVRTAATAPAERGLEFGRARAEVVRATWESYLRLFEAGGLAGREEIEGWGEEALAAIAAWSAGAAAEIEGIAAGAELPAAAVAAVNARTELLARVAARGRAECTVAASVGGEPGAPLGAQTWDWHEELSECWLVWGFEEPSGMRVQTLTEAGMLAKIGVNSAGIGVLVNILHHESDASVPLGVPIHVLLRRILAESASAFDAVRTIATAEVAASSALTILVTEGGEETALTVELRPGARPAYLLPDGDGVLLHTNHFLAPDAVPGDLEPLVGPDSMFRLELLRRRAAWEGPPRAADLVAALGSHFGAGGAICCHPEPGAELGERYGTLATVVLEPARRLMRFAAGGPCEADAGGWTEVAASPETNIKEETHVRAN